MKLKELQHDVLAHLTTALPPHFYYHNKAHTEYVMNAAQQLAAAEKTLEEDLPILMTAALLHDIGFTETVTNHEEASCDIARRMLPRYAYDTAGIDAVCELIMATKLPQQANKSLTAILCDADLYYLGTPHFFEFGENLFREMTALQTIESREAWNELQVRFLSAHHYFTAAANRLLYGQKLANLFTLKARIKQY